MPGSLGRPCPHEHAALAPNWTRFRAKLARLADNALSQRLTASIDEPQLNALLSAIFVGSSFLSARLVAEPVLLARYLEQGPESITASGLAPIEAGLDRPRLMALLRQRRAELALITALADLNGRWTLDEVTSHLTRFADYAVQACTTQYVGEARARGDLDDEGEDHGLIVLAMGKHGAHELNYSSDIDLIVLYDQARLAYRGRETPMAFAVKLARQLTYMLSSQTRDGYVFRTDLRLRPHLPGHPLALSVDDAELYFERHGQNWERAAFIKARAVGGDIDAGSAFLKRISPFIWRRHLDFAAIRDIHSIKRQINAHRGFATIAVAGHDLKVGRGGIREIEFFAQTQQLILGGRHPELRSPQTLETLNALAEGRWIERQTAEALIQAYGHLRALEHRLQMVADKQTQIVPVREGEMRSFAAFAGYDGIQALEHDLLDTLRQVETHYAGLFEQEADLSGAHDLVFTGTDDDRATLETLRQMGFGQPEKVSERIRAWHHGHIRSTRSARARELLTELLPTMLAALERQSQPDAAFALLDAFLSNLPSGVQVFSLIRANPGLLTLLCDITGAAPTLARKLAHHTDLFDIILDAGFLEAPPGPEELRAEFEAKLVDARHLEDVLDLCRQWAHGRQFQAGLQVLLGALEAERASRVHTRIAEVVIQALLPRALEWLATKHGVIQGGRFTVIGLGKLGSMELTTGSDLDIILVFDDAGTERSDGDEPLPSSTYYARASQRLISAISARTAQGRLYEIDTRLRPSGNAGPVACSITNFCRYQLETAETWEHQALTRARFIAGDAGLGVEIMEAIEQALARPRDPKLICLDICLMRERIFKAHGSDDPWNLKYARGGLVDIEFSAQALRLLHGQDTASLRQWRTSDVLEAAIAAKLVPAELGRQTIDALRLLHALQAVLRLADTERFVAAKAPPGQREALVRAANKQLGLSLPLGYFEGLHATLVESQTAARQFFEHICKQTPKEEPDQP